MGKYKFTYFFTYLLTYLVNPAAEQIMPNSAAGYLHRKTAELTLDNDSVSPFFPYVFFHVYTKQDWMSKFDESSNLTLDVLYNGSGYELFRRVPCA